MWKNGLAALLMVGAGALVLFQPAEEAAAQAGATIRVNKAEQLAAALDSYNENVTIELTPGDYGALSLRNLQTSGLRLVSVNPNNPARFTSLTISGSSGITLEGIALDGRASTSLRPFQIGTSQNVHLIRMEIVGPGIATTANTTGLMIRDSQDVSLVDSAVHDFRHGLSMLNVARADILRNDFHRLRTDGVRGGAWSDVVIDGNLMSDFFPPEGDHPDGVQLWTAQVDAGSSNVTISNNAILRAGGDATQGIFIQDQSEQLPHSNIVVSGNLILGSRSNALVVQNAANVQLTGNIAVTDTNPYTDFAAIRLFDVSGTLAGNQAQRINLNPPDAITESGSVQIGATDTAGLQPWLDQWLADHPLTRAAYAPRSLATQPY